MLERSFKMWDLSFSGQTTHAALLAKPALETTWVVKASGVFVGEKFHVMRGDVIERYEGSVTLRLSDGVLVYAERDECFSTQEEAERHAALCALERP